MTDARRDAQPLDPSELDREAQITERDKVLDVGWWKEHGSALTNGLLNALPEDDDGRR